MTAVKLDENVVYDVELESITEDTYIDMKCTSCGYEEQMPDWVYGEEADFLLDEGDPEPPTWQCPKCYKETLLRKPD
jgi:predicted nucleic-acid-binding Zn-ribbon protein